MASPSLSRFRTLTLTIAGLAIVLAFVSSRWFPLRVALLFGVVAAYFLLIGLRTHIIYSQTSRGHAPVFDRPAPEWVTISFVVCFLAVAFWPR